MTAREMWRQAKNLYKEYEDSAITWTQFKIELQALTVSGWTFDWKSEAAERIYWFFAE